MSARGVILDRDGTLVDFHRDAELGAVVSAFHPDQLRLLPGVVEGLGALAQAGFVLAVATNQPGAAKGQVPALAIERTNRALVELLAGHGITITRVAVCLHHPEGGPGADPTLVRACACRKPAPGLLLDLIGDLDLDPRESWMIGDTAADHGAGRRAGLSTALVMDTRRCELCPLKGAELGGSAPDRVAPRFDDVVRGILAHRP